jgi:hypothetical protein
MRRKEKRKKAPKDRRQNRVGGGERIIWVGKREGGVKRRWDGVTDGRE